MSESAIALLEFGSISAGIVAGDAMVKASPVTAIFAGTVHPGNYLVLVTGDTASVAEALEAGTEVGKGNIDDWVFLPDIHRDVTAALVGRSKVANLTAEALGIIETTTVAAAIDAADAGAKAADVVVSAVQLADGLGGKGYVLFSGAVGDIEAAIEAAGARVEPRGSLIRSDVIAQLHAEMAENLVTELRFLKQVGGAS